MDQADFLTEWKKNHKPSQPNASSIVVFPIGTLEGWEEYLMCLLQELGKQKKTAYIGPKLSKSKGEASYLEVPLKSPFLNVDDQKKKQTFIELFRRLEKERGLLLYCFPSLSVEEWFKMVPYIDNTMVVCNLESSSLEVIRIMIQVCKKYKINQKMGFLFNTENPILYEKWLKKIQGIDEPRWKAIMEPVGFFLFRYAPIFEQDEIFQTLNLSFFNHLPKGKGWSKGLVAQMS